MGRRRPQGRQAPSAALTGLRPRQSAEPNAGADGFHIVSPATGGGRNPTVNNMELVFGIVIVLLDLWGIIGTLQSSAASGPKIAWVLGIVIFPVVGFIVWLVAGPKGRAVFI